MTANELLTAARRAGIVLEARGGGLHVEAPAGAVTPALREELARQKPALLMLIRLGDAGVQARCDVFVCQLAMTPAPRVPAFLFRPDVSYVRGVCFSCGDGLPEPRFSRCWRCSLAWRVACRLPIPAELAVVMDTAKVSA